MPNVIFFIPGKFALIEQSRYAKTIRLPKRDFFAGKTRRMILPVSAYLIVHPNGKVLIDTDWNTKYADERSEQFCGIIDKISAPIISKGEGIEDKLKSVGLTVKYIDYVFISHMDFEHASGLRLVREARDIRTASEEWNACNKCSLRYVDT